MSRSRTSKKVVGTSSWRRTDGEHRDPAWAENLRAHPEATIAVRGTRLPVIARALAGGERKARFRRFVERDASFGEYRRRTSREIPVFELRPRDP